MSTFGTVVVRLTGVNGLLVLTALITGPIQARALGPSGRGELAVVITTVTLAPFLLDLGLGEYVTSERARKQPMGDLLGTMFPMAWGMSLLGVLGAIPISNLLGEGHDTVVLFLRIGLFLSPVGVTGLMLYGAARGAEQWSLVYRQRIALALIPAVGLVVLVLLGLVTVASASMLALASGVIGLIALLPALRGGRPWHWRADLVGPGIRFGARSWIATLSTVGNARLDQVIMAPLVSTKEIGLYAVAVSVTSVVLTFAAAVMTALMPRVATGDADVVPRASRIASGFLGVSLVFIAATSPVAVPLLFGPAFLPAVPMVLVLIFASYTLGMSTVIGAGLQGAGRPQDNMRAQLSGLFLTIGGLPLLLPLLGGLGAAVVSAASGAVIFAITVYYARRTFDSSIHALVVPRANEMRTVLGSLRKGPSS